LNTGRPGSKDRKYSLEECNALLDADTRRAVATVERRHPGLPEKALAAFGDAVYNLGPRVARGPNSAAGRHLAAGRSKEIGVELK
jgi:GH24 family phage-related lysozyme (muramidase)